MAQTQGKSSLFSGDVYISDLSAATPTYRFAGNATELTLTPNSENEERINRGTVNYGSALDTVVIKAPTTFSMTLDCLSPENLAIALFGEKKASTQSGGAVVDEALTIVVANVWHDLANKKVSAVSVATAAVPGTPLIEGVDYVIEPISGMILACFGGALAAGNIPILVDYTAEDLTTDWSLVIGDSVSQLNLAVRMVGVNLVSSKEGVLDIDNITLSPSAGFNWLDTTFTSAQFTGTINTTTGGTDGGFRFETSDIG